MKQRICCRAGGEEIVVVFPVAKCSKQETINVAMLGFCVGMWLCGKFVEHIKIFNVDQDERAIGLHTCVFYTREK